MKFFKKKIKKLENKKQSINSKKIRGVKVNDRKKEQIAILGAGNGGRAFAVYLAKKGYKVNLGFRTPENIREIFLTNHIHSTGEITGTFRINDISRNYKKLVSNSRIILFVIPADVHLELLKKIIPVLKNGHIILLNPGRTWGAISVYNEIMKVRPNLKIFVGETQTLLFTCRKKKDYGVEILKIKNNVEYCFYPEINNNVIFRTMKRIFPEMIQVDNICKTSLNNIGAILHPTTTILNSGSICRDSNFLFYKEGILPQTSRLIKQVDEERCKIAREMGFKPVPLLEWIKNVYGYDCSDFYEAFQKIKSYDTIEAPQDLDVRYLTEDVPTGLVPISSLGKFFGIPTPAIDSIITLADILLGTNYKNSGRTIEKVEIPINVLMGVKNTPIKADVINPLEFNTQYK